MFEENQDSIADLYRTTGYRISNVFEMNAYKLDKMDEIENLLGSNPQTNQKGPYPALQAVDKAMKGRRFFVG